MFQFVSRGVRVVQATLLLVLFMGCLPAAPALAQARALPDFTDLV